MISKTISVGIGGTTLTLECCKCGSRSVLEGESLANLADHLVPLAHQKGVRE